ALRLTVDARGVPLATVLEAIANQAKLLIAPASQGGVTLKPQPSLRIDDQPRIEFSSPTAPWSEEWFQQRKPVEINGGKVVASMNPPSPNVGQPGGFSSFEGFGGDFGSFGASRRNAAPFGITGIGSYL